MDVIGVSGLTSGSPDGITQNDLNKIQRMYGCSKFFAFDALHLCYIYKDDIEDLLFLKLPMY